MGLRTGSSEKNAQGFRYIFTESSRVWWIAGFFVGLLCLAIAAGVTQKGAFDGFAREGALRTLAEGLTPAQRAAGRVHVRGRVAVPQGREPLCLAEHQYYVSGKNGGWRTQATAVIGDGHTLVLTDDGRSVRVGPLRTRDDLRFEPSTERPPTAVEQSVAYELMRPNISRSGRIRVDCAEDGATVFIDGCSAGGDSVGPCPGGPVVVTYGDGTVQRRIDDLANTVASRFAGGAIAMLALMCLLWLYVRARPQVGAMLSWTGAKTTARWWIVPVALGSFDLVSVCALALHRETNGRRGNTAELSTYGHWWLWVAAGMLVSTALAGLYRRAALRRVAKLMDETPTSRLAQLSGGNVELAVQATATAAVNAGTAAEEPLAGVLWNEPLALLHVYVLGMRGQGKTMITEPRGPAAFPDVLRVRDESGEGALRTGCADFDLDARAIECTAERFHSEFAPRYTKIFGINWLVPNAHTYRVEESALKQGGQLYVFGEVQAVKPGEGSDYRHAGVVAEVGGTDEKRIVVHAGTERSLRELVRSESQFVTGFVWSALAVAVAIAGADLWLIAR